MLSQGLGRPLDGVRILALEQMQSLPYATQLLARLGADVVKVEPPVVGDQGRSAQPAMTDPAGRAVGATFLRNNLNKRSVCVDLKDPRGRDLVLRLAPHFDVVAENLKAGAADRLGLSYADIARAHDTVVYVSVSGFGTTTESPYAGWPAYASVVEAMSGLYDLKRIGHAPPTISPAGALGDISAALFAAIGILAALRQRDETGRAVQVDVAMLDAVVAMTDIVMNFWSMGLDRGDVGPVLMQPFAASDGWFVLQVGREHQFAKLAELVERPEWATDARFASRQGWLDHLDDELRPAIEKWAAGLTKLEASAALAASGIPAGPCQTGAEVVRDPHLLARGMVAAMPRTDGVAQPVLTPGNPVKLSGVTEQPDTRVPWLGEHTDDVLRDELGLTVGELGTLRAAGVVG